MEEEKAAAYYDELSRKGGGAARFKQGLGFNASNSAATNSSSSPSFLTSFVRASSPTHTSKFEKQAQLESIQNKLKKKPEHKHHSRATESDIRESSRRNRSRSRERVGGRDRHCRKRSRSRDRDRDRERDRDRDRRKRRSRSASPRRERRSERRSRSVSPPRERRRTERIGGVGKLGKDRSGGGGAADYSRLIEGYDKLTPAERVKAKMKLQLAETAEKDETKGSGWERFEFDKDAPLDDEEIEAAEDDAALVKHIGQSFRFTAVEARREERIRDAHDEAMFGAPVRAMSTATSESEPESDLNKKENNESVPVTNLISEKVLAKQQGSWRDRARKV